MWIIRYKYRALAAMAVALIALAIGASSFASSSASPTSPAVNKLLKFDKKGVKPTKHYRIAYLGECVGQNAYCQTRLNGLKDAAKKYGFSYKVFDGGFNAGTQLKVVQDATTEGFDGYIFGPTTVAGGCRMWKQYLKPTGKPVVSLDIPMCGDADYTPGLAATVTFQRPKWYKQVNDQMFANACGTKKCKAVLTDGFPGSDIFTYFQGGVKYAQKKHPNVKIVLNQPGNFDPKITFRVTQDALRAHPDVTFVISNWDDAARGAEQAIRSVGKRPGVDVKLYSVSGTKRGLAQVKKGVWTGTAPLLPWQESYYAAVAMVMALDGQPLNAYVNEAELLPKPLRGTVLITKKNVDLALKYHLGF